MLGVITTIRDEFLPEHWRKYRVNELLPSWPWYVWIVLGIVLIAIAIAEGALRQHHLSEQARSRSIPLIDRHGTPYGSSQKRGESKFIAPGVIVIIIVLAYFFWPSQEVSPHKSASLKQTQPNQDLTTNPNSRPIMIAEAQGLITIARDDNDPLRVMAILSITNRGAPSTLNDFSLHVTLKTGREIKTERLMIGNMSISNGMQFFQHQDISERTGRKLIPTGGTEVGIHYSRLIDLGNRSNFRDATVELHFTHKSEI